MALEIQAGIPLRPPKNSSVPQMNRGIGVAYGVTIYCYFLVSVVGYWAFGNAVASNVRARTLALTNRQQLRSHQHAQLRTARAAAAHARRC